MEEKTNLKNILVYALLYVIFLVGAIGEYFGFAENTLKIMTPYVLLITGITVLIFSKAPVKTTSVLFFISMYLLLFLIEYLGVTTGKIFGQYEYGETLGFKFQGVPVIIGFNWLMIIISAYSISARIFHNKIVVMLFASLLSVILDILIEPAAPKLDYWHWTEGHAPFQNYAAWFVITFVSGITIRRFDYGNRSIIFLHYYLSVFLFFLIINLK